MKNFLRAFEVKYLGPTNNRGSRVKITDLHNNKSVTISFDYSYNNAYEVAENYLEQQGIKILCRAGSTKVDWLLSENFETDLGVKAPKAYSTLLKGGSKMEIKKSSLLWIIRRLVRHNTKYTIPTAGRWKFTNGFLGRMVSRCSRPGILYLPV